MAHIDCNTIPFFWQYANRFTIFDNIFATEDTPSSPNAIAMIAGQSGETQWVKHPGERPAAADARLFGHDQRRDLQRDRHGDAGRRSGRRRCPAVLGLGL